MQDDDKIKSETIIRAKNVGRSYGKKSNKFNALKNINLNIEKGESIAIIGKSGSGKSTLMHILALLDKPTSGEIFIKETSSNKLSKRNINKIRNKSFGFVFQSFFMNANDTVLSNVMVPLVIAGVPHKKRKERAIAALKSVGLLDKINAKANDLSGGQKQRVCIARAIVNSPSVIFADEPTGNLDSKTGENVKNLLFGLNKKRSITLVIVTHDPDLANLCDRQIYIKDGEIQEEVK